MSRGRKSFNSSITDNWEKAFFNSIGHYITLINKGLSKLFKSEPLSNHIKIVGGFAFKNAEYRSSGIPIIRISDFNNERIVLDDVVFYEESPLLKKYELKESDIIIALTGGTIGKLGIVQAGLGKLYLNQRVGKFDIRNPEEFEKEYIYWIASGVEGIVKKLAWGAAIPNVSPKQIEELNFPIPTKDIQRNIIRFLNDLRNGVVANEIYFDAEIENEIKGTQEKQVKAREVQDELAYQLALIDQLNQAILQEAVQGKLLKSSPPLKEGKPTGGVVVEQNTREKLIFDPSVLRTAPLEGEQLEEEETGYELLQRIKAEKAKSGKKEKPLPPIKPEEIPFEIPENWVWCRFNEIYDIRDGTHDSPKYHKEGYPFITSKNLVNGELDFSDVKYISLEDHIEFSKRSKVETDDILFAMIGTIGNPVIVSSIEKEFSIKNVALFKNFAKELIETKFIFWLLVFSTNELKNQSRGGIQKFVSLQILRHLPVPLPPLSEQKRIVAEIEKQLAKTKQLKEHILANQQATEQLLKALLHQAFEVGEIEKSKSRRD